MANKQPLKYTKHECEEFLPSRGYGDGITSCSSNEKGELWADNGEYGTQVRYCPFCGFKAETMPLREGLVVDEIYDWRPTAEARKRIKNARGGIPSPCHVRLIGPSTAPGFVIVRFPDAWQQYIAAPQSLHFISKS